MNEPQFDPKAASIEREILVKLAKGELELPEVPHAVGEVLATSLDEGTDASLLATVIQQDQVLTSHVLRVVNSPAYRGAQEIVALQQAIARLGLDRVREIALTAALAGAMSADGAYRHLADEYWRVSLAAALWAKEVARATRNNVEIAYLCGLLHNLGAPMVLHCLAGLGAELPESAVRGLVDCLATEVGVSVARSWDLPATVIEAITHLEDFSAAGALTDQIAVTKAGVDIAARMLADELDAGAVSALRAVQHVNLYPEDVEALLDRCDDVVAAMELLAL